MLMHRNTGSNKMVLGGVQFGLKYGITNTTGQVPFDDVENIILAAHAAGVTQIDTAHGYGDSELIIGQVLQKHPELSFRVITKLSPMSEMETNSSISSVQNMIDASLNTSIERLSQRSLDTVMLHRASHFFEWEGSAWEHLQYWQRQGHIQRLGVSVQTPDELVHALEEDAISIIQLPFNLLDWRWSEAVDAIRKAKQSREIEIHARSALLQGLLVSSDSELWRRANVENNSVIVSWIQETAKRYTDGNIVQLCIEFVRAQDWIDGVVVGVASLEQLKENVLCFSSPNWSSTIISEMTRERPKLHENSLNPAMWS